MATLFEKIGGDDAIFSGSEYRNDALLFNYIESARFTDDYDLYSDHKNAVILLPHHGSRVWIWTSSAIKTDTAKLIDICRFLRDAAIAKPPHKTFHERETDEEVIAKRRIRMEPFIVNCEISPLSRLHGRSSEARQEREDTLKLIKADIPWEAGAECLKSEVPGNHRDLVRKIGNHLYGTGIPLRANLGIGYRHHLRNIKSANDIHRHSLFYDFFFHCIHSFVPLLRRHE